MKTPAAACLTAILTLAGCTQPMPQQQAGPAPVRLYRDGLKETAPRTEAELRRDEAACRYDLMMAYQNRPYTPPPSMGYYTDPAFAAGMESVARAASDRPPSEGEFLMCMEAKGWQFAGYE